MSTIIYKISHDHNNDVLKINSILLWIFIFQSKLRTRRKYMDKKYGNINGNINGEICESRKWRNM